MRPRHLQIAGTTRLILWYSSSNNPKIGSISIQSRELCFFLKVQQLDGDGREIFSALKVKSSPTCEGWYQRSDLVASFSQEKWLCKHAASFPSGEQHNQIAGTSPSKTLLSALRGLC